MVLRHYYPVTFGLRVDAMSFISLGSEDFGAMAHIFDSWRLSVGASFIITDTWS